MYFKERKRWLSLVMIVIMLFTSMPLTFGEDTDTENISEYAYAVDWYDLGIRGSIPVIEWDDQRNLEDYIMVFKEDLFAPLPVDMIIPVTRFLKVEDDLDSAVVSFSELDEGTTTLYVYFEDIDADGESPITITIEKTVQPLLMLTDNSEQSYNVNYFGSFNANTSFVYYLDGDTKKTDGIRIYEELEGLKTEVTHNATFELGQHTFIAEHDDFQPLTFNVDVVNHAPVVSIMLGEQTQNMLLNGEVDLLDYMMINDLDHPHSAIRSLDLAEVDLSPFTISETIYVADQVGMHQFTVTVTDEKGATATATFDINVKDKMDMDFLYVKEGTLVGMELDGMTKYTRELVEMEEPEKPYRIIDAALHGTELVLACNVDDRPYPLAEQDGPNDSSKTNFVYEDGSSFIIPNLTGYHLIEIDQLDNVYIASESVIQYRNLSDDSGFNTLELPAEYRLSDFVVNGNGSKLFTLGSNQDGLLEIRRYDRSGESFVYEGYSNQPFNMPGFVDGFLVYKENKLMLCTQGTFAFLSDMTTEPLPLENLIIAYSDELFMMEVLQPLVDQWQYVGASILEESIEVGVMVEDEFMPIHHLVLEVGDGVDPELAYVDLYYRTRDNIIGELTDLTSDDPAIEITGNRVTGLYATSFALVNGTVGSMPGHINIDVNETQIVDISYKEGLFNDDFTMITMERGTELIDTDLPAIIGLYQKQGLDVNVEFEYSLDDNIITDTFSIEAKELPYTLKVTFIPEETPGSNYSVGSVELTFDLYVTPIAPEIVIEEAPLYIVKDSVNVSAETKVFYVNNDYEGTLIVKADTDNPLVTAEGNIKTIESGRGSFEVQLYKVEVTTGEDGSEAITETAIGDPETRYIEIVEDQPQNSIYIMGLDYMGLYNMETGKTLIANFASMIDYMGPSEFGFSAETNDIAIKSDGSKMTIVNVNDGYYLESTSDDLGPVLLDLEEGLIVTAMAYNSDDELFVIVRAYSDGMDRYTLYQIEYNVEKEMYVLVEASAMDLNEYLQVDNELYIGEDLVFDHYNRLYLLGVTSDSPEQAVIQVLDAGELTDTYKYSEDYVEGIFIYNDKLCVVVDIDEMVYITEVAHIGDIIAPQALDENITIGEYFGGVWQVGSILQTKVLLKDMHLIIGDFGSVLTDTVDVEVFPYALNTDDIVWTVQANGHFTFDEETGLVTGLSGGTGTITANINGVAEMMTVTVEEDNIETYIDDPLYLEVGSKVTADIGFYLADRGYDIQVYDAVNDMRVNPFMLELYTEEVTNYTLYYYVDNEVTGEIEFERQVRVIDSNLSEVTVHLEQTNDNNFMEYIEEYAGYQPHRYLVYYNHKEGITSIKADLSQLERLDNMYGVYHATSIAMSHDDEIFFETNKMVYSLDKDGNGKMWQFGEPSEIINEASAPSHVGLTFDDDGRLLIAGFDGIYAYTLASSNGQNILTLDQKYDITLEPVGLIADIVVNDGLLYTISNRLQFDQDMVSNHAVLAEWTMVEDLLETKRLEVVLPDVSVKGLSIDDNTIIIAGHTKLDDDPVQYISDLGKVNLEFDEVLLVDTDLDYGLVMANFPYYVDFVMDSTNPVDLELSIDDHTLHVGYNQSSAQGQVQLQPKVNVLRSDDVVYSIFSGGDVVDVSPEGLVIAKKAGYAKVKAEIGGRSVMSTITVINHTRPSDPVDNRSLTVTPNPVEVEYGPGADPEKLTQQLTATLSGTSGALVWSIADDTIATIDQNGLVTAVKTGETTVTVRGGGLTRTVRVTVFFVDKENDPLGLVEFNGAYVSGYPDQTFGPTRPVTRAELATMFARILNLELSAPTTPAYGDYDADHWAYEYIEAATRAGIFSGYEDGTFKPERAVSRGELAATIAKYWDYFEVEVDATPKQISDVGPTHWARNYVYMIYDANLVESFSDGTFRPNEPTLRTQIVVILNTLIQREALNSDDASFDDVTQTHPQYSDIEAASHNAVIKDN